MKKYTECSLVCYEGKDNLYKAYIKCPLVCYEEKKKLKKKRDKCMQCYEGKDKFIQKSILNALWSVIRGTT
jgi:hypothetical protein